MSLEETKRRLDELKKQFQDESQVAFFGLFKTYFEKYPQVESVAWRQYQMGFNDGEPTYFAVYAEEFDLYMNGICCGSVQYKEDEWDEEVPEGFESTDQFTTIAREASQIIYSIDSDVMENIFGNGSEVTVKRDGGYDIEGFYDHG